MTNEPKVICVKGTDSNWYEQAIFIINKNSVRKRVPVDLVAEAERIVSGYYKQLSAGEAKSGVNDYESASDMSAKLVAIKKISEKRIDFIMNMVMMTCCIALAGVLLWNFL